MNFQVWRLSFSFPFLSFLPLFLAPSPLFSSLVSNPLLLSLDSPEEDKMLAEGVSQFCDDAQLDPTSITVLIVAWKFQAATQCEFSRPEFVQGMTRLG